MLRIQLIFAECLVLAWRSPAPPVPYFLESCRWLRDTGVILDTLAPEEVTTPSPLLQLVCLDHICPIPNPGVSTPPHPTPAAGVGQEGDARGPRGPQFQSPLQACGRHPVSTCVPRTCRPGARQLEEQAPMLQLFSTPRALSSHRGPAVSGSRIPSAGAPPRSVRG